MVWEVVDRRLSHARVEGRSVGEVEVVHEDMKGRVACGIWRRDEEGGERGE
jgi:hypothetical protein